MKRSKQWQAGYDFARREILEAMSEPVEKGSKSLDEDTRTKDWQEDYGAWMRNVVLEIDGEEVNVRAHDGSGILVEGCYIKVVKKKLTSAKAGSTKTISRSIDEERKRIARMIVASLGDGNTYKS